MGYSSEGEDCGNECNGGSDEKSDCVLFLASPWREGNLNVSVLYHLEESAGLGNTVLRGDGGLLGLGDHHKQVLVHSIASIENSLVDWLVDSKLLGDIVGFIVVVH